MARNSIIKATIIADTSDLRRGLGRASDQVSRFGSGVSRVARTATIAFAGIGLGIAGAALAAKPLIDAASDFAESASKAQQIFGPAFGEIEAASKSAGDELGVSSTAFLEAAANFGILGGAAGLAGGDLSSFSSDLVTAAVDFGSFNNIDPTESLAKLQSGLAGEAEPLRAFGVFLDDAALSAQAFEMGMGDTFTALSSGEKILVRQAEIMRQLGTTGAAGDFARTSDGLANVQRRLAAQFDNVKVSLGTKLLPVALRFGNMMLDLIGYGERLGAIFNEQGFGAAISTFASDLGRVITQDIGPSLINGITAVWGWLVENLPVWADRIATKFRDEWWPAFTSWIADVWPKLSSGLGDLYGEVSGWIGDRAPDLLKALKAWGDAFVDWLDSDVGARLLGQLLTLSVFYIGPGLVAITAQIAIWAAKIAWFLVESFWKFGFGIAEQIAGWAYRVISPAAEVGSVIVGALLSPLVSLGTKLWGMVQAAWNYLKRQVGRLSPINLGKSIITGIPGTGWIPGLAEGGLVTRPTLAVVGEAGPEVVVPLSRLGSMTGGNGGATMMNVTVNMPPGSDGRDVVRALQQYQRTNGSVPIRARY